MRGGWVHCCCVDVSAEVNEVHVAVDLCLAYQFPAMPAAKNVLSKNHGDAAAIQYAQFITYICLPGHQPTIVFPPLATFSSVNVRFHTAARIACTRFSTSSGNHISSNSSGSTAVALFAEGEAYLKVDVASGLNGNGARPSAMFTYST